jgi:hypothetical protein
MVRLARDVMGWSVRDVNFRGVRRVIADVSDSDGSIYQLRIWGVSGTRAWEPQYNIADAWMLVDALRKRFRRVEVHVGGDDEMCCMIAAGTDDVDEHYPHIAIAETVPEAICLAALAALESPR